MTIKIKKSTLLISLVCLVVLAALLVLLNTIAGTTPQTNSINIWAIFLTGILTGGLTCLAVQGGLLAATIAQRQEEKLTEKTKSTGSALPILAFLVAKLTAYTLLGFLLGWFGSLVQLSLIAKVTMQLVVVIFMFGTALNILNVHPIFRYFVIQPPKFLTRLVRKQSKSRTIFAPGLLGALTVFIPCGTTQAMMALAIGSGSPLVGAAVLFAFVLGTSPIFFILGYFATKLGDAIHKKFMKIAAYTLILLAVFNLNGTLALMGIDVSSDTISQQTNSSPESVQTTEEATIEFNKTSYSPNTINVKAGSAVKLHLVNKVGEGCVQAFTIPKLGIQKIVRVGTTDNVQFTAPSQPAKIAFMCSMGMYKGVINVI